MAERKLNNNGRKSRETCRHVPSEHSLVDELDQKILWELIRDGRITVSALADLLHVSPSIVSTRMPALKRAGVIKSVQAEVDLSKVGLSIQAMVFVRTRAQARPYLQEYAQMVTQLPSVLTLYFLAGDENFLIHLVCTSTEQLRDIVASQVSMHRVVAPVRTQIVYEHALGADYMHLLDEFDEVRRPLTPSKVPGNTQDHRGFFG